MNINLEWYKVFYYVVNEGQFSKAANELYISQPAVSQSIKLLEKYIGYHLFIRTPKGVILTNEGKELYSYVEKAMLLIQSGESKFNSYKNLDSGEIKVGASDTLCSHFLLDHLRIYHEKYPKIKIQVFNKTTYEIIDMLKSGKIDLGFINLPINNDSSIDIVKVKSLQDCFVAGKKYKNIISHSIGLKELVKYPLLMLEKGTNMRTFADNYFLSNGINYQPELELGSINVLTKFATEGFGISFITKDFAVKEIENKEIFIIDIKEKIPSRSIGMIKMKNRDLSLSTKEFYKIFNRIE